MHLKIFASVCLNKTYWDSKNTELRNLLFVFKYNFNNIKSQSTSYSEGLELSSQAKKMLF